MCELVFILKMEQSRISHQLRILRDADLVEDIREGKWTNYRIPDNKRKDLKKLFKDLFEEEFTDSREFAEDKKNLESCIDEKIRLRKCGETTGLE